MNREAPKRYGRTRVSKIKAAYDELRAAVRSGDFDAAEAALDRYEQWADYVFSPHWRPMAFAIKGIVDDCCITNERGEIVEFDHRDFEIRFHAFLAKEAPNEP